MNIYATTDYRKIIVTTMDERKFLDKSFTFQSMATFIRVQKPYLSKVLNKKADFSSDQMYMACEYLEFNEEETQYLMLLLEYDRTTYLVRKKKILSEIQKIQDSKRDSKNVIAKEIQNLSLVDLDNSTLADYYLDPIVQIIHIFLLIPRYVKNPKLIADHLSISEDNLQDVLKKLVELRIIEINENKIKVVVKTMHLPRESKLVGVTQQMMRQFASYRMSRLPWSLKKSWMVTFNSNEESRKKMELEFNLFLEKVRNISSEGPKTDCYQMSFDLFPWSKPE